MKTKTQQRESIQARAFSLNRILVPLDFSGKSRQALEFAVPLAKQYGAKIFLIHVVEPVYNYPPYPGGIGASMVKPNPLAEVAKDTLSTMAAELVPPELLGKLLVRVGSAYDEIVNAAEELDADLIALTTHGRTGLKHALLGSTAERVVRHAHCAVLAVRRH